MGLEGIVEAEGLALSLRPLAGLAQNTLHAGFFVVTARKATLASVLAKAAVGIRFNEHLEFDDGEAVFHHACKMGLEGIVSKRKDRPIAPAAHRIGSR
jgi:hypothetical protein